MNLPVHFGAFFQHVLHFWTAQVKVAIFETQVLARLVLLGKWLDWQGFSTVQNFQVFHHNFHITAGDIWVLQTFAALSHHTASTNHKLIAQTFRQMKRLRLLRINHQLHQPSMIA